MKMNMKINNNDPRLVFTFKPVFLRSASISHKTIPYYQKEQNSLQKALQGRLVDNLQTFPTPI